MSAPTPTQLAALTYWNACKTLRNPFLSAADKTDAMDTLHQLATNGSTRVRSIAARRLTPQPVSSEGGAA
jgi:hypothetical protein